MKKIYLSLVIVLASVFMANEAKAQQFIGIDNQRADDLAVTINWIYCGGGVTTTIHTVCAYSALSVMVPANDGLIMSYQTDQTIFVCSNNCGYRIGSSGSGVIQVGTTCDDYTPKTIFEQLWSGFSGGTVIGNHVFNYTPGRVQQGIMTFFP